MKIIGPLREVWLRRQVVLFHIRQVETHSGTEDLTGSVAEHAQPVDEVGNLDLGSSRPKVRQLRRIDFLYENPATLTIHETICARFGRFSHALGEFHVSAKANQGVLRHPKASIDDARLALHDCDLALHTSPLQVGYDGRGTAEEDEQQVWDVGRIVRRRGFICLGTFGTYVVSFGAGTWLVRHHRRRLAHVLILGVLRLFIGSLLLLAFSLYA